MHLRRKEWKFIKKFKPYGTLHGRNSNYWSLSIHMAQLENQYSEYISGMNGDELNDALHHLRSILPTPSQSQILYI